MCVSSPPEKRCDDPPTQALDGHGGRSHRSKDQNHQKPPPFGEPLSSQLRPLASLFMSVKKKHIINFPLMKEKWGPRPRRTRPFQQEGVGGSRSPVVCLLVCVDCRIPSLYTGFLNPSGLVLGGGGPCIVTAAVASDVGFLTGTKVIRNRGRFATSWLAPTCSCCGNGLERKADPELAACCCKRSFGGPRGHGFRCPSAVGAYSPPLPLSRHQ